ncbi:putative sugar nucleotidyl transferase [Barnesiella propionica]|uniref:putative sugar nucleotidyl transferase n=1 Tax=Barnesiella propionica TaxID=2981781 RepID=UPI0011CB26D8|nr:putative sugar nucleotidyl transferase [Barnesiella propionica]MCU6769563.1 putative sugar nucleotidyl transferase [Barnesiella propionica]
MNIILFDTTRAHENLLPLTFTRPLADIRIGIFTIREKWEKQIPGIYSYWTEPYLSVKFPAVFENENLFIAGNCLPSPALSDMITDLSSGEALTYKQELIAYKGHKEGFLRQQFESVKELDVPPLSIEMLYDIFIKNGEAMIDDFKYITSHGNSSVPSPTNRIIGDPYFPDGTPKIFIEPGATVECAVLNVMNGPIYIGKEVEIMEGSCIRAPFAACNHSVVNMGTRIYGATTLGPYCKAGGELNNVVMFGYSNKAHDGFLGNAVIGEWCNLGAGATASNLKNDYSEIKLWNYTTRRFLRTGLQFCGLIMGDHSKAGINTMFNTATVIGVGVNIHGAGFPRNFVASFSEGGTSGFNDVQLPRFFSIAEKVMARRNMTLTEIDKTILESIYNQAEQYK